MSQNIIGLDIGSYSIKLVEVLRDFRDFRFVKGFEARIPLDPKVSREEAIQLILEEQFQQENFSKKTVICAFPGTKVSARLLSLPVKDRRKIEKMVPYEIESQIPMDLDTIHHDWDIFPEINNDSPTPTEGTTIFAVSLMKENFSKYLNSLKEAQIDPREITLDSLSLSFLIPENHHEADKCIALMDCGHSKTNICVVKEGKPIFVRTIAIAGREITRALEKDFNLAFLEAETMKLTDGQLVVREGPGITPEIEKMAKSIKKVVDELAAELRQTLINCEENIGVKVEEIHLFGGTAKLKNLSPYLSRIMDLPVKRHNYFSEFDIDDLSEDQAYVMQPALALALRGFRNKPSQLINFRKGEFRYLQSFDSVQGMVSRVAFFVLVILFFVFFNLTARTILLSSNLKAVEKKIETAVKKVDPNFRFRGSRHALSVIQTFSSGTPLGDGAGAGQGKSPLIVLQNLSKAIPKNINLNLTDINIDFTTARIIGKTNSREDAEKVRELLDQNEKFPKVVMQNVDRQDKEFLFDISISLLGKKEE